MTTQEILQTVCTEIKNYINTDGHIDLDTDIRETYALDSLDMIILVINIEDAIGHNVSIPDSIVKSIKTPKDFIDIIEQQLSE